MFFSSEIQAVRDGTNSSAKILRLFVIGGEFLRKLERGKGKLGKGGEWALLLTLKR